MNVYGTNAKKQRRGSSHEHEKYSDGLEVHYEQADSMGFVPRRRGAMAHVVFSNEYKRNQEELNMMTATSLSPSRSRRSVVAVRRASCGLDDRDINELQVSARLLASFSERPHPRQASCFQTRPFSYAQEETIPDGGNLSDRLNDVFRLSVIEAKRDRGLSQRKLNGAQFVTGAESRRYFQTYAGERMGPRSSQSNPNKLKAVLSAALDIVKDIDLQDGEVGELNQRNDAKEILFGRGEKQ